MDKVNLVINESYWQFFTKTSLKEQTFLLNTRDTMKKGSKVSDVTINLAGRLKSKDLNNEAIYGVEIKTNGSSRTSRIPLVRYTKNNQTIFKIIRNLKEVDKGIVYLKKLEYYLRASRTGKTLNLPEKAIVVLSDEGAYIKDKIMKEYVFKAIKENNIIWLSADFLEQLFSSTGEIDFDGLLTSGKIYTKEAL